MSIEKFTIQHGDQIPYTTLPNATLQHIHDPVALAIWCYLSSKPSNWVVYKNHVCEHFNIGKDKASKAFRVLKDLGLLEVQLPRDDCGHILGKKIVIYHNINSERVHRTTENPTVGKTDDRKTRRSENPPLQIKEDNKEKKDTKERESAHSDSVEKSTKKTKGHKLPDDFDMSDSHRELAKQVGMSMFQLKHELDSFREHFWENGKLGKRWDWAFNRWIRNAKIKSAYQIPRNEKSYHSSCETGSLMSFTAWYKKKCRDTLGKWRQGIVIPGMTDEMLKAQYQDYLQQEVA